MSKSEYEKLAGFRYALRQFMSLGEKEARALGLSPQQHQAMLATQGYHGRDYVTVGELAEMLQIRHHSAVGLVDRLEAQGLARRRVDGGDRRRVLVSLTPEGLAMLEQLSACHRDELKRVGRHLNDLIESFTRSE